MRIYRVILLPFMLCATCLYATRGRSSSESEVMNDVLSNLNSLRLEVNNHETEIRMFEEKFKNQEEILESLRRQTTTAAQTIKDTVKGQSVQVEAKLAGHETLANSLSQDLKLFAKDSALALSEYKAKLVELEKAIEAQNRTISNLQIAVKSILEALQVGESVKTYQVKSGDSLGEIAKQHKTTIKKLKELNGLTNDQITIGQKLKLPEA